MPTFSALTGSHRAVLVLAVGAAFRVTLLAIPAQVTSRAGPEIEVTVVVDTEVTTFSCALEIVPAFLARVGVAVSWK